MIDFSITEQDIAISKARWEPEFRAFAERSSRLLSSTRRLPIFADAVSLARAWLNRTLVRDYQRRNNRTLLLIGDEHLATAGADVLGNAGIEYTHIFPTAWIHWLGTEFRGSPGWWIATHWAINNPQRLLHFAEFEFSDPGLKPNESYLLSSAYGSRGTDSICRLVDGKLHVDEPFAEWVECA
ncbi:hypothetical protein [Crateriforma spongiae]|uniref:hypothetical protein n=1 Tax=Crateriforma spongiae TaxID=2724528 RepID=UPI001444E283|nr:hypothetical protein [Crateriforma spongiae]